MAALKTFFIYYLSTDLFCYWTLDDKPVFKKVEAPRTGFPDDWKKIRHDCVISLSKWTNILREDLLSSK